MGRGGGYEMETVETETGRRDRFSSRWMAAMEPSIPLLQVVSRGYVGFLTFQLVLIFHLFELTLHVETLSIYSSDQQLNITAHEIDLGQLIITTNLSLP